MQRKEWTFEYTASKLAEAAQSKKAHHLARLDWWKSTKDETMSEVRASGIEVSESAASAQYSTANMGPQVMVRNDLQRKLTECHTKIQTHEAMVREYDGWLQVLNANPENRLSLHHDDWLYFFGQ